MKKSRTRTLQSAKYLERKKKKLMLNITLATLGVGVVFGVIVLFLGLSPIQISKVNVEGVKTLDEGEIRGRTLYILQGKYLGLIPKSNTFLYSKEDIENYLKDSFKKIDSVEIDRSGLKGLNLKITESIPVAIACDGFRDEETQDKCFFVDKKAYVFEPATLISEGVYLRYYSNSASTSIALGNEFMDKNRFQELQDFVNELIESGIPVVGVLVGDGGSYELYVQNKDQSITVVYFDDRTAFSKTSSNFKAFWQSASNNQLGSAATPVFDYINLRFGNNIFYTTR